MWQMDIQSPSITFTLDHYDREHKSVEIKLMGRLAEEQIWYAHRINLDWLEYTRYANHDESFITQQMLDHLLHHIISEKHTLEKAARNKDKAK